MKYICAMVFLGSLLTPIIAEATPASDALLKQYKSAGAKAFDIERGGENWHNEVKNKDNELLSCGTCHGSDLSKSGKHRTTNKIIKPMAPSANPERFTDEKKN